MSHPHRHHKRKAAPTHPLTAICAVVAALGSTAPAHGFAIDTGNEDLTLRWDNTVRYNLGVRAEKIDDRATANGLYDESDSKFKRGRIVNNRIDILSETDISYKGLFGARLSGAAWYDNAYDDSSVHSTSGFCNVTGCQYNSTTKRYYEGPSGELLDAFVFGKVNLGASVLNMKLGRHTVYWGEGLLFPGHGVSYSQGPIDGRKALTSPGAETKELFLPLSQISAQLQLTPTLSFGAQYFLQWAQTRTPLGGTYLSPQDILGTGNLLSPGTPVASPDNPPSHGNYGVSMRLVVPEIDSKFGFYYRVFDDYNPWTLQVNPVFGNGFPGLPTSASGRFIFANNVKLYGFSAATVAQGVSIGFDLSYRKGAALNSNSVTNIAGVSPRPEGARGNTWHAVVNGVSALPNLPLYDTGTVVAELATSYLDKVTSDPGGNTYKGGKNCPGGRLAGCSTNFWSGIALNVTPQYLQVLSGLDLDVPLTLNYGLYGNAPTNASAGSKHEYAYSVGVRGTYQNIHELTLRYSDRYQEPMYNAAGTQLTGGNGSNVSLNDRGYVSLTYKTSF